MILKKEFIDFSLTLKETHILKGCAILILLYNHLFPNVLLWNISISMFLFLSGYGLSISYRKISDKPIVNTLKFQARRYVKFYANYWVIFLIFVPLGLFVFDRSLSIPYESNYYFNWIVKDILGLNGLKSYNITWWFNQAIVVLYLLFPFLYFAIRKISFLFPVIWYIIWILHLNIIPEQVTFWSLHFCFGIFIALNIEKINLCFNRLNNFFLMGLLAIVLVLLGFLRQYVTIPKADYYYNSCIYGAFIAVAIVFIITLFIRLMNRYINSKHKVISKIFVIIGKHSRNIYLIHTFIYLYFFKDFIYSFKYQILSFLVLLAITLTISIIIEFLKEKTKYKKLEEYIISKI